MKPSNHNQSSSEGKQEAEATPDRYQELARSFSASRKLGGAEYEDALQVVLDIVRKVVARKLESVDQQEDLAQEILLSVHEARFSYDSHRPILPWLYAIIRFRMIDYWRKHKKHSFSEEFSEELHAGAYVSSDEVILLQQILQDLPKQQRDLVEFVKIQDRSLLEASHRFGLSEGAIKVSIHRALQTLKGVFGDKGK